MGRIKLFMIIICFVECCTMSLDEIEDFANFLDRTSQLDQNLKKGTESSFDYDEDEIISDHAWEDSGKFEGDLVLNKRQRRLIIENVAEGLSRNGLRDGTKMWPNGEVIYYIQKEHFTPDQMQAIQNGIDDLARASCVKFRPYQRGDRDAVVIQGSRRGCFSQVGYQGGYQVLNLSGRHPVGRGCFRHGTVVHELLHSLGFFHMQSSPDRDDYVDVLWPNIIQQARHNFRKYNSFAVSDFGVGYDYDSVLHYSRRAFSSNGQDTIVPKKSGVEIGQRVGLSQKDVQKLNKMYCDADSSNSEADEESKQPETKTRSAKNKPFEGHGIGYHQGKAVVIKLLPAAETYKLPDVPSFHLFDYFSKAPQAMSTSEIEGFRVGKEMIQPYHPHLPYSVEGHKKLLQVDIVKSVQNQHSRNILKSENPVEGNVKPLENVELSKESIQNNTQIVQEPLSNENNKQEDEDLDENLFEAFERLGKVIEPYSNKYETDKSHGSFYSPEFAQKGKNEQIPKVNNKYDKVLQDTDEDSVDFSNSPYSFNKDESNNDELIKKFNKQSDIKQVDKPEQQEDSSHKTGFPLQAFGYYKQGNLEPTQTPEYQSKEALFSRSNYTHLYPKKQNYKRDKVGVMKYILFGEDVPLYEDKWYKNNEFTFNPAEYERLINIKSQR